MRRRARPRAVGKALETVLASIDAHVAETCGQGTVDRLAAQRAQRAQRAALEAADTAPRPRPALEPQAPATEAELEAEIAKAEHDGRQGIAARARAQLASLRRLRRCPDCGEPCSPQDFSAGKCPACGTPLCLETWEA